MRLEGNLLVLAAVECDYRSGALVVSRSDIRLGVLETGLLLAVGLVAGRVQAAAAVGAEVA